LALNIKRYSSVTDFHSQVQSQLAAEGFMALLTCAKHWDRPHTDVRAACRSRMSAVAFLPFPSLSFFFLPSNLLVPAVTS